MSDWKTWCRGVRDLTVDGDVVEVQLPGERVHRVTIADAPRALMLQARIATRGTLDQLSEPELYVWTRNRTAQLVGFRIDKHDRLIGEAWVPKDGLVPDELVFYLRTVAADCDRLEALLTGEDKE
jgi:hypothetical protein